MAVPGQAVEVPGATVEPKRRASAAALFRAVPISVVLTLLIAASTALRLWAGTRVVTPWIISDEITYSQVGRSLFLTGHLDVLDRPIGFLSLAYPALIGLPFAIADVGAAYAVVKGLQALVVSLTAVPVFLWARTLVSPRWALTAAALTLTLPGLAYSGVLMTEVAFLPLGTLAAWAMAAALARPTWRNQVLVGAAIALVVATRLQAAIFVPAFATAVVLKMILDRRVRELLRAFAPSIAVVGGLAVLWIAFRAVGGQDTQFLGGYQGLIETRFDTRLAAEFVIYHAADVILLAAVLPVIAVVLLVIRTFGHEENDDVKAYVAVVSSLVVWLVLEVGVFAARWVGHLAERNLLPLAPVLFVGFVVWLERGAPRPRYVGFLAAMAAFVLLAALPARFVASALPDAFMLVPLQRIQVFSHPNANLDFVYPYLALPLLALFAFVPRRLAWLLPVAVAAVLVYTSVSVNKSVAEASRALAARDFGASKNWIDRASRGPVGYLYAGGDWNPTFESIFWNRRLRNVYAMPGTLVPGPLPQTAVQPTPGGVLRSSRGSTMSERYVVTGASVLLAAARVATAPAPKLTLWRTSGPPRVSAWLAGVDVASQFQDRSHILVVGEMGDRARLDFYGCGGGTLKMTLAAPEARTVTISGIGGATRRVRLRPGKARTIAVRSSSGPGRDGAGSCEYTITTSGGPVQLRPLEFRRR